MMRWSERQRGALALGTVLLLLVLISWVVVVAVRIATGDQRSLGNELGQRSSLAMAEAGRARAMAYLSRHAGLVRSESADGWMNPAENHWLACVATDLQAPCGDGLRNRYAAGWSAYRNLAAAADASESASVQVHLLALTSALIPGATQALVISIVSESGSADGAAHALVYQDVLIYPLLAAVPEAPLMAAQLSIGGNGSLIANPDGFAASAPLTAWAAADALLLDAVRSCLPTAATSDGCPAAGLSRAGLEAADILDVDGNQGVLRDSPVALAEPMERVFGLGVAQWRALRSQSTVVDCSAPSTWPSAAILWSVGDCVLPTDRQLGSPNAPAMLIIEDGDLRASGGSLHGIVFLLSTGAALRTANLQNGFRLTGALLANGSLRVEGERYQIRYDAPLLRALTQTAASPLGLVPVPGSWRDFP